MRQEKDLIGPELKNPLQAMIEAVSEHFPQAFFRSSGGGTSGEELPFPSLPADHPANVRIPQIIEYEESDAGMEIARQLEQAIRGGSEESADS